MISLYDHQEEAVAALRDVVRVKKRALLVAPTGTGKTRMALRIIQGAISIGHRCWFIVHRRELCRQTSNSFWQHKLSHGMIMAGKARSPLLAQVGTVITAANRIERMPPDQRPRVIIFDEAHRSVSVSYQKIINACPDAYIIGLTATPQRTDGRGLGELYSDMVQCKDMAWLIEAGFLSPYRLIAPVDGPDLAGVRTLGGDYDTEQVAAVMNKPSITGDAIAAYKQYASGKRCMVFCASIKHSESVCAQYNAAGIPAEHIDGTYSDTEREAALNRFRAGQTLVLCTVQLAIEGLDIPAVEAVQQLRPTQSIIVYLQLIGRGLRVEPGKQELIILDQVSNWRRHGLPDDPREWTLEGRKKRKRGSREDDQGTLTTVQCKSCYHVQRKGPATCARCGSELPVQSREIDQKDGVLAEIDLAQARKQTRVEQGRARGLSDLVRLGIQRGMKSPAYWAAHVYYGRMGIVPSRAELTEAKAIEQEMRYARIPNSGAHTAGAF